MADKLVEDAAQKPAAHSRPMTEVDITEEDAEFQEALRVRSASKVTPVASFWQWHG